MDGHHNYFVNVGLVGSSQVPSPTSPRCNNRLRLTPTGRTLCSLFCQRHGITNSTYRPFSANSTAQTKDGPRGKSDKIDGGLFGPPAAHTLKLQPASLQRVAFTSRAGHSPHLTTQQTVRYGRASARWAPDRRGCGADYRIHYPVRRGREALRETESYGRAVVVRRFRRLHLHLPTSLSSPPWHGSPWPGKFRRGDHKK